MPAAPGRGPGIVRHDQPEQGLITAMAAPLRIPGCAGASASCWEPGVLVNYVDPDQPLCWAPQLQQEFCLTDGELGWPFSEFFWSYALMQIPTGMILDRFGVRKVYRVSAFLWSFTSAAIASAIALEMLPL
jgi:MFS family permease